jgi:putative SOS response-associated peptidase YedK
MIITEANEFVGELHDRMPVILEPEQFEAWLTGAAGLLLKPAGNDVLQCWPVSRRVNRSRAPDDDPSLIEAVAVGAGGDVQLQVSPWGTCD